MKKLTLLKPGKWGKSCTKLHITQKYSNWDIFRGSQFEYLNFVHTFRGVSVKKDIYPMSHLCKWLSSATNVQICIPMILLLVVKVETCYILQWLALT